MKTQTLFSILAAVTLLLLPVSALAAGKHPVPIKNNVAKARLTKKEIIQKNIPSTVMILLQQEDSAATGSGALISKDGLIITCYHVIEGITEGFVRLNTGEVLPIVEVMAVDPVSDLAIIRVNNPNFQPIKIGDSSKLELGDDLIAIGSPHGLEATVSDGIVSSIRIEDNRIQFTAPISPGSSGGPLFNSYGELVGIVSASWAKPSQNLNFATPSNEIRVLLSQIETTNISFLSSSKSLNESFEKVLNTYLASHEQNSLARLTVAKQYLKKGNADKVLELMKSEDKSESAVYLRAKALFLKNEQKEATQLLESLPEHSLQEEPALYLYLANMYLDATDLTKAKQALEKYNIFSQDKGSLYYYTVGELATAYGLTESRQIDQDQYFEKAIGFYEIADQKDPTFVSALYKKGLVELTMGDFNSANETYKVLATKDAKLAKQLEGSILQYLEAYRLAQGNFYRELGKEQLRNNLALLLYSILLAVEQVGY